MDLARLYFVHDVTRLEAWTVEQPDTNGFAVRLTNASALWDRNPGVNTNDAAFRTHEGRTLTGTLTWGVPEAPYDRASAHCVGPTRRMARLQPTRQPHGRWHLPLAQPRPNPGAWKAHVLPRFDTERISNGGTEAVNCSSKRSAASQTASAPSTTTTHGSCSLRQAEGPVDERTTTDRSEDPFKAPKPEEGRRPIRCATASPGCGATAGRGHR